MKLGWNGTPKGNRNFDGAAAVGGRRAVFLGKDCYIKIYGIAILLLLLLLLNTFQIRRGWSRSILFL